MALYEKLEYELEFITPAFIGGAFPDKEAELRPTSFIGILRWWFRNLALTVTDDINAIANLESELFGNTERAGKVWVKFEEPRKYPFRDFFEYLSRNGLKLYGEEKFALTYLGYGNFQGSRTTKAFVPAGERVKVTFLVPSKYRTLMENLLYLVSQLGTIGGRSRRGWGSFFLTPKEKREVFNSEGIKTAYVNFKGALKKLLKTSSNGKFQQFVIYLAEFNENRPLKALANFGAEYKTYRAQQRRDSRSLKNLLITGRANRVIYNRSWFGLPILARYRNLRRRNTATVNLVFQGKPQRLASPMMVKVVETQRGKYDVLITLLVRPFMGKNGWRIPGGRVMVLPQRVPVIADQDFYTFVVQNFLKSRLGITEPVAVL
jgi:CRISPR-associated protein Cmr1